MTARQTTGRCPRCKAKLGVPAGFRSGECPACGAWLEPETPRTAARPKRNPGRETRSIEAAEDAFETFHGTHSRRTRLTSDIPDTFWLLGSTNGLKIEYQPPKYSERGDSAWSHEWGDKGESFQRSNAQLYSSADGRWLLIPPANFKTDKRRGIVG